MSQETGIETVITAVENQGKLQQRSLESITEIVRDLSGEVRNLTAAVHSTLKPKNGNANGNMWGILVGIGGVVLAALTPVYASVSDIKINMAVDNQREERTIDLVARIDERLRAVERYREDQAGRNYSRNQSGAGSWALSRQRRVR